MKGLQPKGMVLLKAVFISYFISAIIVCILALLMYKMDFSGGALTVGVIIAYIASCFCGGFLTGKMVEKRQFMWGAMLGILYFLLLLSISALFQKDIFDQMSNVITVFFMCALGGMVGGMVS